MASQETLNAGEALERRHRVLDLSGWGRPFRLWQPHNLCFWIYIGAVVIGIFHMVSYFAAGASAVPLGLGAGAIATTLYSLVFLVFLRLTDHYERQPRTLVFAAFLWGAVAATFAIALTANNAMLGIYPKLFGQAFALDWAPALTAPFSEETSKAAGFLLLMGLAPRLIRSPYDGVFIGAFIGLGFQLFEDVLYDFNSAISAFGENQIGAALATFVVRALSGLFSHALYSAVFCCGIIYIVGTPVQKRRLGLGVGLLILAMMAHGVWDGAAAIGSGALYGLLIAIVLGVIATVAVLVVLRVTVKQEREFLRAIMEPEVENGTITAEELDALCASRRKRRKFIHEGRGHARHRSAKHVLRASLDLAHEIAKSGGQESSGVEHEREEIARLRAGGGESQAATSS